MTTRRISTGSTFERLAGYSRAVIVGDDIHVSGTTGFDYQAMTISADVVEQTRQAFRNIEGVLKQANASLADVIRVRYYLTDAAHWEVLAPIFGEFMGKACPAATAVVVQLVDPRMKIEIEATARAPRLGCYSLASGGKSNCNGNATRAAQAAASWLSPAKVRRCRFLPGT